jgi:hypothetical protein
VFQFIVFDEQAKMAIIISERSLLDYHNAKYLPHNDSQDIKEHIEKHGTEVINMETNTINQCIRKEEPDKNIIRGIEMSSLEIDTDSLEQSLELNRDQIMLDHETQDFINSQRIHKANFLKEIGQRGIKLKNDLGNEEKIPEKRVQMNY